jgi:hypothetical protein
VSPSLLHHRYRCWLSRDRGGISVFAAIVTVPLLALGGLLAVDGLGKLRATERADALAMEAARAGAQAIDPAQAIVGDAVVADRTAAAAAAQAYLERAGTDGAVAIVAGGTRVQVTVRGSYETRFLTVVGVSSMPVAGHGQAALLHGVTNPEDDS